jgi:hypothetical protein
MVQKVCYTDVTGLRIDGGGPVNLSRETYGVFGEEQVQLLYIVRQLWYNWRKANCGHI